MINVRVLFHIDENEKWTLLLRNVQNLIREVDMHQSQVEVVANAAAVTFYRKTELSENAELSQKLADAGVLFVACCNALQSLGIAETDLRSAIRTVPSGVVELALRQEEGYSYIKP